MKAHRAVDKVRYRIAHTLRCASDNGSLFPAVAQALGVPWPTGSTKALGRELVLRYASQHGLLKTPRRRPASTTPTSSGHFAVSPDFLMSYEWRRLRMVVLKKRGRRCECCGAIPTDGVTVLNVDHIKPRKLFPNLALDEDNLQVLCGACNHGKGNWDQTDWRSHDNTPPSENAVLQSRAPKLVKRQIAP